MQAGGPGVLPFPGTPIDVGEWEKICLPVAASLADAVREGGASVV